MTNPIHPLVLATLADHCTRRELELERLRSARNSCTTVSPGGQARALSLGKKIREVESILAGWRLVIAVADVSVEVIETGVQEAEEAAEQAAEEAVDSGADRVVGSRTMVSKGLRCVPCTLVARAKYPRAGSRIVDVTSEDLPGGGMCSDCGVDVLA